MILISKPRFGRRKTLLGFILVMFGSTIANAFIFNIPSLLAFRFLAGLATTSTYMNCFVLALEFLGPKYRLLFTVVQSFAYSAGGFMLTGLAYGLRDYEFLCLALTGPAILCFSAYWLAQESPRWMLSKGRIQEARRIIEYVAKVNGKPFPEETFAAMVKEEKEEEERRKIEKELAESKAGRGKEGDEAKPENVFDMFHYPRLTLRVFIVLINWMSNAMTYYGILFNVQNLSGDIYLNFFLTNCVDLLGFGASYFIMDKLGRKKAYLLFLGLAMLACLASIFPPLYAKENEDIILTVLSLVGRFGISTSFQIIYLFSGEIYPTTIRNTAMGMSSMFSRVGSLASPYIADLGKTVGGEMKSALPLIIFGAAAFLSWIGALILPETSKYKLPDTILEAANYGRKSSNDSNDTNGHPTIPVFHIKDHLTQGQDHKGDGKNETPINDTSFNST